MKTLVSLFFCCFYSHYLYANNASGSFTCTSGKLCTMQLNSTYVGHGISPSYNYDLTAWQYGNLKVENNTVSSSITYTYSDGSSSYAPNIKLILDNTKRSFAPVNRPSTDKNVSKLQEFVSATFINESSESESGYVSIIHDYGQNSDQFDYAVTVLPPPPVCTTTVSNANLDMGTFTTSQLASLSPGQSAGVSKSVKVVSQCSYSSGINISLSTNKVTSAGYLAAGGGLIFIPDIDGKKTPFGSDGNISFSANSGNHSFNLGFTAARSDEKPAAGNFNNIITITTTPL